MGRRQDRADLAGWHRSHADRAYVARCFLFTEQEYSAAMAAYAAYRACATAVAKGTEYEAGVAAEIKVVETLARRLRLSHAARKGRMAKYEPRGWAGRARHSVPSLSTASRKRGNGSSQATLGSFDE